MTLNDLCPVLHGKESLRLLAHHGCDNSWDVYHFDRYIFHVLYVNGVTRCVGVDSEKTARGSRRLNAKQP
jgi:hypothetical protein